MVGRCERPPVVCGSVSKGGGQRGNASEDTGIKLALAWPLHVCMFVCACVGLLLAPQIDLRMGEGGKMAWVIYFPVWLAFCFIDLRVLLVWSFFRAR